jgi:hypothetical protein
MTVDATERHRHRGRAVPRYLEVTCPTLAVVDPEED